MHTLGFKSQWTEIDVALKIDGKIPDWVSGTLIRNGPGCFETATGPLSHWFDGAAMLHAFSICNGHVSYANRFLETQSRRFDRERSGRPRLGFGVDPCRSLFSRVLSFFFPGPGDNANVNLDRLGNRIVALTETPPAIEFDPHTLKTIGRVSDFQFPNGQLTSAHPHHDPRRKERISYTTRISLISNYQIYRHTDGNRKPDLLASIPVGRPSYIHSISITENFVVFVEYPLRFGPLSLAFNRESFADNLKWEPKRGARFHIVGRNGDGLLETIETDSFFCFHHVNAYEEKDLIVVDLAGYEDADLINQLRLDNLRTTSQFSRIQFRRCHIDRFSKTISQEVTPEAGIELPRINSHFNGQPYCFAYGIGQSPGETKSFPDRLLKVESQSLKTLVWHQANCFPGEPVFIRNPHATSEDDGVLLSVVLDAFSERSFFLVLDAATMNELARANVPQHIPFGFHGQFFGDLAA